MANAIEDELNAEPRELGGPKINLGKDSELVVAADAVLGFEIVDDGLDRGVSVQLACDLRRHQPLLAGSPLVWATVTT